MKWGSFLVKAFIIYLIMWCILIYGYGDFFLSDSIVPEKDVAIDEWLNSYYIAGAVSAVIAFICSCIWFYFGINYSGGHGISLKHKILWIIAALGGLLAAFLIIMPAVDGKGLSLLFAWIIAPLGYYIVSLFDSAEAVKFIPPFGESIHK